MNCLRCGADCGNQYTAFQVAVGDEGALIVYAQYPAFLCVDCLRKAEIRKVVEAGRG